MAIKFRTITLIFIGSIWISISILTYPEGVIWVVCSNTFTRTRTKAGLKIWKVGIVSNVVVLLILMVGLLRDPFLVVIIITPFEASLPYRAEALAPLRMLTLSMSFGLIELR